MPQIAQQDYLCIEVPEQTSIADVLEPEQMTELHRRGVLFDVIVKTKEDGNISRVVSYTVDQDDNVSSLTLINVGNLIPVQF